MSLTPPKAGQAPTAFSAERVGSRARMVGCFANPAFAVATRTCGSPRGPLTRERALGRHRPDLLVTDAVIVVIFVTGVANAVLVEVFLP